MPNTWSQLYLHVVFSTKLRRELITADVEPRLYEYIGGILRDFKCVLLKVGGMPDHIHLLIRFRTDTAPADLVRHIKFRSSKWIHETFADMKDFAWQEGSGSFTVSPSQLPRLKKYIANQVGHHRTMTFQDEYLKLLKANGIDYDDRYVFD